VKTFHRTEPSFALVAIISQVYDVPERVLGTGNDTRAVIGSRWCEEMAPEVFICFRPPEVFICFRPLAG
jgi:hypothetical protein